MNNRPRIGTWVSISREYVLALDKVVTETEGLIGLVIRKGDFCGNTHSDDEMTLMVFAENDGEYVGCDSCHLKHITPIKKPAVVASIKLLPIASIDIRPGYIDTNTGEKYDGIVGREASPKKLRRQIESINRQFEKFYK